MRNNPVFPAAVITTSLLTACGTDSTLDSQGELASCEADSAENLSDLTLLPEGFSLTPEAALVRAAGEFSGTVTSSEGASTADIALTVNRTGELRLERRSWQTGTGDPGSEALMYGGDCLDAYVFDANVTLVSDSALNETFDAEVSILSDGTGSFYAFFDYDSLTGDAAPASFIPDDMAETQVIISGTAYENGWTGEVGFQGTSEPTGSGAGATVSSALDIWGEFTTTPVAPDA